MRLTAILHALTGTLFCPFCCSGIWSIEWQIARWTGLVWDTVLGTQIIPESEIPPADNFTKLVQLNFTKQQLYELIGGDFLTHPNRLKVAVRAINRAGLRSCASCVVQPCSCADSSFYAPWAAETGLEVRIDIAGPTCAYASAWICDPGRPTADPPERCHDVTLDRHGADSAGAAGGGFLSRTDELRVQFSGFDDPDSEVAECRLDVLNVPTPGKTPLGLQCICSEAMPPPYCDCGRSPVSEEMKGRCLTVDANLQQVAMAKPPSWRMSTWLAEQVPRPDNDDFYWADSILDASDDELGSLSVCAPPIPIPKAGLSEACSVTGDCAPLTPGIISIIDGGTDQSVICVPKDVIPWYTHTPTRFCCSAPAEAYGVCLPSVQAAPWLAALSPPVQSAAASPPASPPHLPSHRLRCSATDVVVQLTTSDTPPHPTYQFSHVSWHLDGEILRPDPNECSPDLCGSGTDCGCLYRSSSQYEHSFCLTPGRHTLTLEDHMGYGWFGANVSVNMSGYGRLLLHDAEVDLHDPAADEMDTYPALDAVTIPTPRACYSTCGDPNRCFNRLFDTTGSNTCSGLYTGSDNCECEGCCLGTDLQRDAFRRTIPTTSSMSSTAWWHPDKCRGALEVPSCGVVRRKTVSFEVYDLSSVHGPPAPPPPTTFVAASVTVPCTGGSGVNEVRIRDLELVDKNFYVCGLTLVLTPTPRYRAPLS